MSPAASTRWCPTPEQLMILEEMYRGGVRTPNASQIQQITAHLSYYGKIEGKNVFYWFQNHKARDRQKLRRKLSKQLQQQQQQPHQLFHNQQNHHLLQFSRYNSAGFFPQGGLLEDSSRQLMNYTQRMETLERNEMEKSLTRIHGCDWTTTIMKDVAPSIRCSNRPLKTLELFPITSTGLKDQSSTSN